MSIKILRLPAKLEDYHFTSVPALIDPADGRAVDALTVPDFAFDLKILPVDEFIDPAVPIAAPDLNTRFFGAVETFTKDLQKYTSRRIGRFFVVDQERTTVTITASKCKKLNGTHVTGSLLDHEQIHWNIFFLVVRTMAKDLASSKEVSDSSLQTKANAMVRSRLVDANGTNSTLQALYDLQSNHNKNVALQNVWSTWTVLSLLDPNARFIGPYAL